MKTSTSFKLIYKLFLVIFINLVIASSFFVVMIFQMTKLFQRRPELNQHLANQIYLAIWFISFLIFIIGFALMVNKKIKQIKELEREIELIASGNLGQQIQVKGTDELASLTKNVNQMSTQLKETFDKERLLEQEKHQILSNLSHDLKTPLTSIKGYLQLIKDFPKEHTTSSLEIIERKTDQIDHLVNQLGIIDQLVSHQLMTSAEHINLSLMSQQLFFEYESLFAANLLKLESSIDNQLYIWGNLEQFTRAAQNLFSNAIKYAPKDSVVVLHVFADEKNEKVIWSLRNKTDHKTLLVKARLIDRTFRVDASRGKIPGDGLGLSIVEEIMRHHNGKLIINEWNLETIEFQLVFPVQNH